MTIASQLLDSSTELAVQDEEKKENRNEVKINIETSHFTCSLANPWLRSTRKLLARPCVPPNHSSSRFLLSSCSYRDRCTRPQIRENKTGREGEEHYHQPALLPAQYGLHPTRGRGVVPHSSQSGKTNVKIGRNEKRKSTSQILLIPFGPRGWLGGGPRTHSPDPT